MTSQTTRNMRSRNVTVDELNEVRDGVYHAEFTNEDGEERDYVLIPREIFSSSPDMIHRTSEGVVGKYLLAAASYDDYFHESLKNAVTTRKEYLEEKLETQTPLSEQRSDSHLSHTQIPSKAQQEIETLRETRESTSDDVLQAELTRRIQELQESQTQAKASDIASKIDNYEQALSEL